MNAAPVSITRWFNEHDPYFERPCKALVAGYTLKELAAEYESVFANRSVAARNLAQDLTLWLTEEN